MRLHRDGYIQAGKFECNLSWEAYRRAQQVGSTRHEGFAREIGDTLGVCIDEEDITSVRMIRVVNSQPRILVQSQWVSPTRR